MIGLQETRWTLEEQYNAAKQRIIGLPKGQPRRGKKLYHFLTIFVQFQRSFCLEYSIQILQQCSVRALALEQVAFVLLIGKFAGGPPPHQPVWMHFVIYKGPPVRERPQRAYFGGIDIKMSSVPGCVGVGASCFVQLLSQGALIDLTSSHKCQDVNHAYKLQLVPKPRDNVRSHTFKNEVSHAGSVNALGKSQLRVQMHSLSVTSCMAWLFQCQRSMLDRRLEFGWENFQRPSLKASN